eukprot:CAMPEP_0201479404 /NCGR_PEP_ID=MMETSP0151_2-20130828/4108_1 /ASSEMBLY_ACC=CAM_ASM_000257 /TAXON_ID=200890 /ORGANISM="Paramoeba atlantica, Strain 621/1 / CCAP 1560/9" /LENGTH=113 /DNA_ID=CAMNT_0047860881 /DNA_START=59 /DNA_END=400 /DNA_ORIENTATION=-
MGKNKAARSRGTKVELPYDAENDDLQSLYSKSNSSAQMPSATRTLQRSKDTSDSLEHFSKTLENSLSTTSLTSAVEYQQSPLFEVRKSVPYSRYEVELTYQAARKKIFNSEAE